MITSAYFWYGIAQGLVGLLQPTQILHLCLSESCYQLKCIITLYTDKIDFFVYILLYSIYFSYVLCSLLHCHAHLPINWALFTPLLIMILLRPIVAMCSRKESTHDTGSRLYAIVIQCQC